VVIKFQIDREPYFLMRRDRDWSDITFIGGHEEDRDGGSLEKAARRELVEEVPPLRLCETLQVVPLAGEIYYGPIYSRSARCQVEYTLQYFLLRFGSSPGSFIHALGPRTPNILVRQETLLAPCRDRIARLVPVLNSNVAGGLSSIPYSWPNDLGDTLHTDGHLIVPQYDLRFG
jgi:hypothetical protein